MSAKLANNAISTLAAGIASGDTSLAVQAGDGAKFPSLSGDEWFPITVVDAADPSLFEIMKVTAISTDTMTVSRAQEGTSARAFTAGDVVELRMTAAVQTENRTDINAAKSTADSAKTTADAALPATNGKATKLRYSVAATTDAMNMNTAIVFTVDNSTDRTLSFDNVPSDATCIVVKIDGSDGAITWPAGILGETPELGDTWTLVTLFRDGSDWHFAGVTAA